MLKKLSAFIIILALCLPFTACAIFSPDSKKPDVGSPKKVSSTSEELKAQLSLAAAFLMEGDYDKAMPELAKARQMDPKNVNVENYFGLAYYRMQNFNQAIESFNKALSLDSNRADIRNNLGLTYMALQKYDQALVEFNKCVDSPDYQNKHLPLTNIAMVYYETGRFTEALNALGKATEANNTYARAYQLMGRIHLTEGNNRSALEALKRARDLEPNDPETLALLENAQSRVQ